MVLWQLKPSHKTPAYFFFSFLFFLISWRLITLQYCSGFCHTLTWISLGYTCIPHPDPPLPPPSPPDPSGSSQCTRSEHLSRASNLGWWSDKTPAYFKGKEWTHLATEAKNWDYKLRLCLPSQCNSFSSLALATPLFPPCTAPIFCPLFNPWEKGDGTFSCCKHEAAEPRLTWGSSLWLSVFQLYCGSGPSISVSPSGLLRVSHPPR